jgi:PIN domain nuclease of toxin-antitoxin system
VRVLADTHALVWAVSNPELLGSAALAAFENEEIVASVASLWELSLKSGKKNGLLADPVRWWRKYVTDKSVFTLPIRTADVIVLNSLAEIHKDPFDRILVAQSLSEGIPLVTRDEHLALYGIPTIW